VPLRSLFGRTGGLHIMDRPDCYKRFEKAKQSSKTAGRTAVVSRKCWHENYPRG
jgi:hypothetical protein